MAKKTNGKPKAKDLLSNLQKECVGIYGELVMQYVDDAKEVVVHGMSRKIDRIVGLIDLLENSVDCPNEHIGKVVNSIFDEYVEICESIESVDLAILFADIFDDLAEFDFDTKRNAVFDYFVNTVQTIPFLTLQKVQIAYKQLQYTCNEEFKRYWRMSIKQLVDDVNEQFLYTQSLMLQKLQSIKVVVQEHEVEVVSEEEDVTVVKFKKITDREQLQQLARNNGFEFKSQKGSHRKYEDANGKVVVVPIHNCDIGKGLSHEIQKQILNN